MKSLFQSYDSCALDKRTLCTARSPTHHAYGQLVHVLTWQNRPQGSKAVLEGMAAKLKAITCTLLVLFIVLVLLDLATFGVLIGVGK